MERIRYVFCGLLLVLGLSCCPVPALASEGFIGGLEDLTGTREVEKVSYEERYQEDYEPDLTAPLAEPTSDLGKDATTVDYVNDTVDSFNSVKWAASSMSLLNSVILWFSRMGATVIVPAVGLVFAWWGVRKSKNIVMKSATKGRIEV